MTSTEIATMIASIGLPSAYNHFPDQAAPALPFICFYYDQPNNFVADNKTYQKVVALTIELYTANKDLTSESAVENVLAANELPYRKSETFIDSEKMYLNSYETEVIYDG